MAVFVTVALAPVVADAHGVARGDARFLATLQGAAVAPLMYLGAKHMVTGTTTCCSWSASSFSSTA